MPFPFGWPPFGRGFLLRFLLELPLLGGDHLFELPPVDGGLVLVRVPPFGGDRWSPLIDPRRRDDRIVLTGRLFPG